MLHSTVALPASRHACPSTDHLLLPFLAPKGLRPNVEGAEPRSHLISSGISFPISFSGLCSLGVSFPSRIVELNWSSMKLWRTSLSHFCTLFLSMPPSLALFTYIKEDALLEKCIFALGYPVFLCLLLTVPLTF